MLLVSATAGFLSQLHRIVAWNCFNRPWRQSSSGRGCLSLCATDPEETRKKRVFVRRSIDSNASRTAADPRPAHRGPAPALSRNGRSSDRVTRFMVQITTEIREKNTKINRSQDKMKRPAGSKSGQIRMYCKTVCLHKLLPLRPICYSASCVSCI